MGETDLTTANAASRLRFGTNEWESASAFWDAQDVNDHAPKIWWDGNHTIFHIVEGRQHGDILLCRSIDNGVTWSKAEVMRARGESAGNPIRTKEGVISIPFDFSGLSISRDNVRKPDGIVAEWMTSAPEAKAHLLLEFIRPSSNWPTDVSWPMPAFRRRSPRKSVSTSGCQRPGRDMAMGSQRVPHREQHTAARDAAA